MTIWTRLSEHDLQPDWLAAFERGALDTVVVFRDGTVAIEQASERISLSREEFDELVWEIIAARAAKTDGVITMDDGRKVAIAIRKEIP